MDDRANYKPTKLYREPRKPWRSLLLAAALVMVLGYGLAFTAHAIADWLDRPHSEIGQ